MANRSSKLGRVVWGFIVAAAVVIGLFKVGYEWGQREKPSHTLPSEPPKLGVIAERVGLQDVTYPGDKLAEEFRRRANDQTRVVKYMSISARKTVPAFEKRLINTEVRWLQLDPSSRYVQERAREVPRRSQPATPGEIKEATEKLKSLREDGYLPLLSLRYYDEMPVFRLVIMDDVALVSYYPVGRSEDELPVYVFKKEKDSLFGAYDKYFDTVWQRATPVF